MNQTLEKSWNWLKEDLRRPAVLISIIFSIWAIWTHDVINTDGVLYLDVAYHISNLDWKSAAEIYHWNFYPALIALVSTITFLDLEASAFLINNLFLAGLAWIFLSILMLMGANRSVLIAGLVLISIHPYINDYRADIIRGPGFWFFTLYGTYHLIKLQESSHYKYGILASFGFVMAMLFRIEGTAFVLLAPLILLAGANPLNVKFKKMLSMYIFPSSIAIIALIALMASGGSTSFSWSNNPAGKILHPLRLLTDSYQSLINDIPAKGEIIANQVLNLHSEDFGTTSVIAILMTILILTALKRITALVFLLAGYGAYKQPIKYISILIGLSLINLGYMAVYVTHEFFLSSRFAMPIAIFFALAGSYGLALLFSSSNRAGAALKSARAIAIFFMVIMLIDGLFSFGASKTYLREGGQWVGQQLNKGEKIISNQILIYHYANKRLTADERQEIHAFERELYSGNITETILRNAQYIAIRTKHVPPETLAKLERLLKNYSSREFSSSEKERLVIYSRK